MSDVDVESLVYEWFVWKSAGIFLERDAQVIGDSNVRFPTGYQQLLIFMKCYSERIVEYYYRQIRKRDIRILAEQEDCKEFFVLWKHRGSTRMLRIHETKIRIEVQEKINEIINRMSDDQA